MSNRVFKRHKEPFGNNVMNLVWWHCRAYFVFPSKNYNESHNVVEYKALIMELPFPLNVIIVTFHALPKLDTF